MVLHELSLMNTRALLMTYGLLNGARQRRPISHSTRPPYHAHHWATLPWLPDNECTVSQPRRPEPGYVLAVVMHYQWPCIIDADNAFDVLVLNQEHISTLTKMSHFYGSFFLDYQRPPVATEFQQFTTLWLKNHILHRFSDLFLYSL